MSRLSSLRIVDTLSNPLASPIPFWPGPRIDVVEKATAEAPWLALDWCNHDAFISTHEPRIAIQQALGHARIWAQYSAHAGLTAGLRCAVPPAMLYLGHRWAQKEHLGVPAQALAAAAGFAAGCLVSPVGIGVNLMQASFGLVAAAVCVGLSGFYLSQQAIATWLPVPFVAAR